jgi:hypothetical protein
MSAQPLDAVRFDHVSVAGTVDRPHAAVPTDDLIDALEGQHERGEPLDENLVFEALARLAAAEGLAVPAEG